MNTNKPRAILLCVLLTGFPCFAQQQILPIALAARLDSILKSNSNEKHFGELYLQTTHSADIYIESLGGTGRLLMKKLEERFAIYFLRAIDSNNSGGQVPDEWKKYFNGNYSPLQLKLMGANAHINGDIWQVLTNSFSLFEIRELTPFYRSYSVSIRKVYDQLFDAAINSDKRLRNLHLITFGLDKVYGRMMLKKWRNRQLKLALLKYENEKRFIALKIRIDKKRNRIDKMIIRRLRVKQ
jgi:hypothetical protein